MHYNIYEPPGWSGWNTVSSDGIELDGDGPAACITQGTSAQDTKIFVFALERADDHGFSQVYMNVFTISLNSWTGWIPVPGSLLTDVSPATLAIQDLILLFAKDPFGNISINAFDLIDWSWGNWQQVGGATDAPLSAYYDAGQRLVALYAKGFGDTEIYVNYAAIDRSPTTQS